MWRRFWYVVAGGVCVVTLLAFMLTRPYTLNIGGFIIRYPANRWFINTPLPKNAVNIRSEGRSRGLFDHTEYTYFRAPRNEIEEFLRNAPEISRKPSSKMYTVDVYPGAPSWFRPPSSRMYQIAVPSSFLYGYVAVSKENDVYIYWNQSD